MRAGERERHQEIDKRDKDREKKIYNEGEIDGKVSDSCVQSC